MTNTLVLSSPHAKFVTLNSFSRLVTRVSTDTEDFSFYGRTEASQRNKIQKLESLIVAATLCENKEQKVEIFLRRKAILIEERNNILDKSFMYLLPKYKKKLQAIDVDLDRVDLELYQIECINIAEVQATLQRATDRLSSQFKCLKEKAVDASTKANYKTIRPSLSNE